MYALDIWEPMGHQCPNCGNLTHTGGWWRRLGTRKTRRAIVNLANRSLSTGFNFRIQERTKDRAWINSHMRGVKGYGE